MKNSEKISERIEFLAKTFDVFDSKDIESTDKKFKSFIESGYEVDVITGLNEEILALVCDTINSKGRSIKKISVSSDVFVGMMKSDPTKNKTCLQWMLNVFSRLVKDGNKSHAIRFAKEDLPQANKYLTLFEENKRKQKFKTLCRGSYILRGITDPTDINQYKSLSQLFDAVDPFIEKDVSAIERKLQRFVDAGQAEIPVKDRKFTLYIPKTTDASVIFEEFANWCTARKGNGMFTNYTNQKTSIGEKSNIFIIIDNNFFSGKSKEIYQIHFESNQIKDRHNGSNVDFFKYVISESEGISNYFYEELLKMAKADKSTIDNNKYLKFLIQFGFTDSVFELIDENTSSIRFMSSKINKIPNLSKFKLLDQIIITNAGLTSVDESIGNLSELILLVLAGNDLVEIPREIGKLNKLKFINLVGNPLKNIPEDIKYLDKSNGGSLLRICVKEEDIGADKIKKLKELLPSTTVG